MFVADDRVIYSASDLAAAARCEYALLRAFDAKLGRGPSVSVEDELLARTAELGDQHEQRHLDELRSTGDVVVIGRPAYSVAGLRAAAEATLRAVQRRAPVIYQAAMFDGRFAGFADFLVLDGERYRLRDTKLARSVKVEALLQLAAYAEALAAAGVAVHEEVELVLGNGVTTAYRVDELLPVYRSRRADLQALLDRHAAGDAAVDWADESVRACMRCPECEAQVREHDDLLLVAGMRVSQRSRLIDAGITTVAQLAAHDGPVPELAARALDSLRGQARLQLAPRIAGKPPFEVVDPQPLMLLPDPDRGDLFFDFEGDPLWTADGTDWGLEYLFGVLGTRPDGDFQPLWAHDRRGERKALKGFLELVRKRRKRYPKMHIYHYAAYEKTALLRLAGRYGEGEDEVDDLLRNGVLVDLYPLVRKSIRVGTENYSLKSLEPLYMGAELRTGDVTTATDSITMYARYCELLADDRADEAATVLKEIEDYNHYDCRSTRMLRDWLLRRAFESGVPPLGAAPVQDSGQVDVDDELARTLGAFAGDDVSDRSPQQRAVAMIAAARGYHRREDKPFWWRHFDRLNSPVDEWSDTPGVFLAEKVSVETAWNIPPRARKQQRRLLLTGSIAAGELNRDMYAMYDPPSPAGLSDDPERRAYSSVDVLECDDPAAPTEVLVLEREPKSGGVFDAVPFALTPGSPFSTKPLRQSIDAAAAHVAAGLPALPLTAVVDILLRRPPRTRTTLPRTGDAAADITAAVLGLDSSYVAVHGPPGTGKTHTAARVIAALVTEHGWRVGVVAQSHAVVENLFCDIIGAGVDPAVVAKKRGGGEWTELDEKNYPAFIADHDSCVIGGTAWDFANASRVPPGSLDLLVIEEAGQFCLANTIAVAQAATNLLLLGDPQQLPQVSQGTHPEPVDASALGWLVDGRHTLPEELGYFLDRSYRMHPAVCAVVSRLSYDNRLHSVKERTAARRLAGVQPGVHVLPVAHDGNSTDSRQEAQAIVTSITAMLGAAWTDEDGTRPLTGADVLIVTPYNAQVVLLRRLLDTAGLSAVQAGTVDKFQGRQAPVVFVSLVASSIAEVPRGISFLLNRNRLNVAVSRAKYAAVIVRSAMLTDYLPSTPAGLVELGAFLAMCDRPSG
ncbi:TM0106 family RecB-like putative nuclease [Mycobacterium sp. shizuoka-1]|uniref:TM0106 family RecB-like putative nuclease n=1 Tax=Mycobacterium sp. shizuoka-1 TaxID=2039281 RepID=UPI000C064931|nr:TM0106 family RecB-like putative nuclease [Mycobacterium sp. shizuoka-1]GAY16115.1 ATPase [Mycobacterium sp. shizuoka-1]